jgi:hypothetical protein
MKAQEIGLWLNEQIADIAPVHAIIADSGAFFPHITYQRTSSIHSYTKDYLTSESVTVSIDIFTTEYEQGVFLATDVRNKLEHTYSDKDVRLESTSESRPEDAFIQTLTYSISL